MFGCMFKYYYSSILVLPHGLLLYYYGQIYLIGNKDLS